MKEYLKNNVDASLHELIRRHVVIPTQNYQHRVKAFITNILQDKNNPMHVEHWSTKVEFQGRGAGHNHGTIWVDMNKMEFSFLDNEQKWSDIDKLLQTAPDKGVTTKAMLKRLLRTYFGKDSVFHHTDIIFLENIYAEIFQTGEGSQDSNLGPHKIVEQLVSHFPFYSLPSAFKKFQTKEKLLEQEEKAVTAFVDKFTTCTLNEAVIASKTDDSELKKSAHEVIKIVGEVNIHRDTKSCRKYETKCRYGFPRYPIWKTLISRPLEVTGDEGKKLKGKYEKVLKDVKELLEDKDVIKKILEDIPKDLDLTVDDYKENRKKRILMLLSKAKLESEEQIQLYEDALKFSTEGYSVVLERDLDELYVNSYNPE